MRSLSALVCVSVCLCACTSAGGEEQESGAEISEPIAHATYYVVNQTESELLFRATRLWDEGALNIAVPAGESAEVDRVSEGSGGHTLPSNFYESHTVTMDGVAVDRTLSDADWTSCEDAQLPADAAPQGQPLCLVLTPADFP